MGIVKYLNKISSNDQWQLSKREFRKAKHI